MNYDDFTITGNGDGTFTLTPKSKPADASELVQEYRRIKSRGEALLAKRQRINAELATLVARRDELRALLLAESVDPDGTPVDEAP